MTSMRAVQRAELEPLLSPSCDEKVSASRSITSKHIIHGGTDVEECGENLVLRQEIGKIF